MLLISSVDKINLGRLLENLITTQEADMFEVTREPWGFWVFENNEPLAAIVRSNYKPESIQFLTPDSFGLQLALMNRQRDYEISPHEHLPVNRDLIGTQEVLVIKSGCLQADLYGQQRNYLCSVLLEAGDVILLNKGGHGFRASEDCFFIEVKQGPYTSGRDKEIFESPKQDLVWVK